MSHTPDLFAHFRGKLPYKNVTILVVEDNPDQCKAMKSYLERELSCNVVMASAPDQAFTQIAAQKDLGTPVRLIISDAYLDPSLGDERVEARERAKNFLKKLKTDHPDITIFLNSKDTDLLASLNGLYHAFILKSGFHGLKERAKEVLEVWVKSDEISLRR